MSEIIESLIKRLNENSIDNEKEYLLFHRHRFEYIFSLLREYDKNKPLLDIGAHYLHGLAGAFQLGFKNLFGIDLNIFNSISADRAKSINATIKNCDLASEPIPFADNDFDIILFTETLEHFNFHPKKVFAEIFRVLRPGGELIITTPNLLRLNNRIKMMLGKGINYGLEEACGPGTHYREYAAQEIEFLMASVGLKKIKLKYIDFNYPNRSKIDAAINLAAGFAWPSLKSNLVIIGKKN